MDKLEKRLRKLTRGPQNAVVVGNAFGKINTILNIYKTVFVINDTSMGIRSKNLVYRENFSNLNQLAEISAIFFDLSKVDQLPELKEVWRRNNSLVIIEGSDPIDRSVSMPLYDTGWGCTSLQSFFHVWEQIK
jgi:hypothetical protein